MGVLERVGRGRLVVLVMLAVGLGGATFATCYRRAHPEAAPAGGARAVPGERDRIAVEVLNTTAAVGLARAATRRLRDAGLDVVYYGTDAGAPLDSTDILVRRGDAAAGDRVRRALGAGRVRVLADSTRVVDVTVRLGRDFPPAPRNP